jgi:hypothetical protein
MAPAKGRYLLSLFHVLVLIRLLFTLTSVSSTKRSESGGGESEGGETDEYGDEEEQGEDKEFWAGRHWADEDGSPPMSLPRFFKQPAVVEEEEDGKKSNKNFGRSFSRSFQGSFRGIR